MESSLIRTANAEVVCERANMHQKKLDKLTGHVLK